MAANTQPSTSEKARKTALLIVLAGLIGGLYASCFSLDVTEYGVVTRFGNIVRVDDQAGLKFKLPFDQVQRLDKRLQALRPPQAEYLSADKKNLVVHSLVIWRLVDPRRFLATLSDQANFEGRLSDIVLAKIGGVLGDYPLDALISTSDNNDQFQTVIERIHTAVSALAASTYGVEIVDTKLRQLNLPTQNQRYVFERMQAERGRIAMQYRSEGEREAQKITASAKREKTRILAEAYHKAKQIRGEADAEVMRIYADRFGKNPAFYQFVRTLQALETILDDKTTLFLPADAEAFRVLQNDSLPE